MTKAQRGIGFFKENSEKFSSKIQDRSKMFQFEEVFGDDLRKKLDAFGNNLFQLERECTLMRYEGSVGQGIPDSAFFLNCRREDYLYFKSHSKGGDQLVLKLASRMAGLVDILEDAFGLFDPAKRIPDEEKNQKIAEVGIELGHCVEEAAKDIAELIGLLKKYDWKLLNDIKNIGQWLIKIEDLQKLVGEKDAAIKDRYDQLKASKNANSEKAAKNFAKLYEEVKCEIEKEIKPWSCRKNHKNFESHPERIGKILKFLRLNFGKHFSAHHVAKFLEGAAHIGKKTVTILFSLRSKIFLLRTLIYVIPALLLIFHFCEFFKIKDCRLCSWFPKEIEQVVDDENVAADLVLIKTGVKTWTAIGQTNYEKSTNYDKPNSGNRFDSYLYFHLALITIFLVAFQQLRSAIKDLNIKRNLFEVYRHRVLVAENFDLFRNAVDGDSKNEVVKSAVAALFANEPSIYESKPSPIPPQAFDIKVGRQ